MIAVAAVLFAGLVFSSAVVISRSNNSIVVGSKNFTEQIVLGEIVAQTIERETGLPVERRLNLGGTLICDRGLLGGEIDVYVEYTGTSLTAIFSSTAHQRFRNRVRDGSRSARPQRTYAPPTAGLQQYLRNSGSWA